MIKKWRPSHQCIYVIPEIHGNDIALGVIMEAITPLRRHIHKEDQIVFLGDYIDGGTNDNSPHIIDILITLKNAYPDRVHFLRGNHEDMLIRSLRGDERIFKEWTVNSGGLLTLTSYIKRSGLNINPFTLINTRIRDFIPPDHIDFFYSLKNYLIIGEYFFIHAGFDPMRRISENNEAIFPFDDSSGKYVKKCLLSKLEPQFKDNYTFVVAHNSISERYPFIHQKYFMLGGEKITPKVVGIFELNSMEYKASINTSTQICMRPYKIWDK